MQTIAQRPVESAEELERILAWEIDKARAAARPISRVSLARLLHEQHSMPLKEAEEFVERFCDEHEPAVPEYLSSEFGVGYLKVLAILNVLIAISFLVVAARFARTAQETWMGIGAAMLFLGLSAFSWVNSLKKPDEPKKMAGMRRY